GVGAGVGAGVGEALGDLGGVLGTPTEPDFGFGFCEVLAPWASGMSAIMATPQKTNIHIRDIRLLLIIPRPSATREITVWQSSPTTASAFGV
ncbi:MAG: hypothetical protein WA705_09180, partial [Candidatus Ozemobacteraceae bacterium]